MSANTRASLNVDPVALALKARMGIADRGPAAAALRELADRGLPTHPNAVLSDEQFSSLTGRARHGLRRFWQEAQRQQLRTNAVPAARHLGRQPKSIARPKTVDAVAWEITSVLSGNQGEYARRGLRLLDEHGLSTDLAVVLDVEQSKISAIRERIAVGELWSQAHRLGLRPDPAPPGMTDAPAQRCPPAVDDQAWEFARQLSATKAMRAREGLKKLALAGHATDLNVVIPVPVFLTLNSSQRWSLRALWDEAISRGQRNVPSITRDDLHVASLDLLGIDRTAVDQVPRLCRTGEQRPVRIWLQRLRDAGQPTDLDADLDTPAIREVFAELTGAAGRHNLYGGTAELSQLRGGLRHLYVGAVDAHLRSRGVPTFIAETRIYARGERADLTARLPVEDQDKVAAVSAHLLELNRRQQAGRLMPTAPSNKRYAKKRTESQGNSMNKLNALSSFLHHAAARELADLAGAAHIQSPWRIEAGLLVLVTPENVADWVYLGCKSDGSKKRAVTMTKQGADFCRLLERAEEAKNPLLPQQRRLAIQAALRRFEADEELNVEPDANWGALSGGAAYADFDDTGKWFPTLDELDAGVSRLKTRYLNARQRRDEGRGTRLQGWRAARDHVLAYGALVCMWRVDTACTIDLARLAPDPRTGRKRWSDGSIHIRAGARAKQSGSRSYFVPDLLIPAEIVELIEALLKLEGRSLEHPLAEGEVPVHLRKGERWGNDRLLEGDRFVIPLFRKHPDAPNGLGYIGIGGSLSKSLLAMGFDAINPHTMRAAGAILWRFLRDGSYASIMRLGLWSDERTLVRCYARLSDYDLDAEIARRSQSEYKSPPSATALTGALDEAHRKALEIRTKANATPLEFAAAARVLHATATALERAAGKTPIVSASPSRLRDAADDARVDTLVRALVPGGLNEFLGYDVIADPKAKREKPYLADRRVLGRLREEMARSARKAAGPAHKKIA